MTNQKTTKLKALNSKKELELRILDFRFLRIYKLEFRVF